MNRAPVRTVQLYETPTIIRKSIYLIANRKAQRSYAKNRQEAGFGDPECTIDKLLSMKALVISRLGGPEVLQLQEVPDTSPVAGQEIVSAQAGGLNFADVMTMQGGYPGAPKPPLVA